jgi:hypothetical protein
MEIKYALIVLPALQALLDTAESGVPVAWAPRLVGKAIELVHFIGLVCGNTGNDTVARELLMHLPAAVVLRVRALESKDCTLMYTCASPRRRADMPAVPLVFSITRASVTVGKKDFSNAHVLGQPKVDEIRSYGPPAKKRRSGDGDYMWEEIDCEFEGRAYCRRAVDVAE